MKNRAIEFYRFLAIMCIAVFHFNIQFTGEFLFPKGGYLGVEFFFILSGFLLMKSFKSENRPKTAWEFWIKRISRLYPAYIMMMVIFLLFDISVRTSNHIASFPQLISRVGNEMWDLLLLHDIGIPGVFEYEGSIWFLCSLSINLYVIYYLLLRYEDVYTDFLIPVLCILGYGYIGKQFGSLSMQEEWAGGVLYGALMRGFLDMSLGVMAYRLTAVFCKLPSYVLSAIETVSIFYSLKALNIGFSVEDFKLLVLFPVLIASVMTGKSIWSKLLNFKLSDYVGSISYEIYLNHLLFSTVLTMSFKDLGYKRAMLIFIVCTISFAVFMHVLIRCCGSWVYRKKNRQ